MLLYLAIGYLIISLFIYLKQDSLLFYPIQEKHQIANSQAPIVSYQFENQGIELHGWLLHPEYAAEKLLIYYGGNAEDVFYSSADFLQLENVAILLVEYRGYGNSSGTPSEQHFFHDALQIFDDCQQRWQSKEIMVMGRSIGTGVACFVASQRPASKVILVTPFDSMLKVAQGYYPWLPVRLLMRHPFNSLYYIPTVQAPFLIISAGQDEVIPPARTENLISHLPDHKQTSIARIPTAGHNDIHTFANYWPTIQQFL